MSYIPEPITRIDKYLAYIAGNMNVALPDHPITRKEHYLAAWAEKSGFEDVDVAGDPPLTLKNGIGKPLKGLRIYGKSKQVTTTGAQLFPPPTPGSQEKNGITIDCMEGGKIHISGTAETMVDFYVSRLQLPAGTYTFSAGVNIDASTLRYALVTKGGVLYFDVNGDYTTDTIAETIDVSLMLRVYAGKTIDLTVQPMLNAGSTPLPWEPYTGGKPSPSPDYPQEIESVGQGKKIGVEVRGKNLLDPAYVYENTASNYKMYKDGFPLKKGVTYTLSCYPVAAQGLYINEWNDGNNKHVLAVVYDKSVLFYTPEQDKKVFFDYYHLNGLDPKTSKLMLEIGANDNPAYEPYHDPQSTSISIPNGLPGIPVSSGGNYTDADGQQWVCDEIDFARGMYVQRVAYTTVDGDAIKFKMRGEFWNLPDGSSPGCSDKIIAINMFFLSNKFGSNGRYNFIYTTSNFMKEYFETVDELNEFCKTQYDAGTPLTLYYELTTPIETPLNADQLNAYKALHTYKGTTIIDNDAGAYMSAKYEKMK